jgi:hypothetical protein
MPWTIPNLLLHDKSATLSYMRSLGRNHVVVCCSNSDCHHNAEIDASGFPDDMTFGDLQPRMLRTVCDHRGADVSPSWPHHAFEDTITLPDGRTLSTLRDAGDHITSLPKAEPLPDLTQPPREE